MTDYPSVADEVAAVGGMRPGHLPCIHCGQRPAMISVFCSRDCQARCLAECGSSSGRAVTGDTSGSGSGSGSTS